MPNEPHVDYLDIVNLYWPDLQDCQDDELIAGVKAWPEEVQNLYLAYYAWSAISGGGLVGALSNGLGRLLPEAVEAFRQIGMPKSARSLSRAVDRIGDKFTRSLVEMRETIAKDRDLADDLDRIGGEFSDHSWAPSGVPVAEPFHTSMNEYACRGAAIRLYRLRLANQG